MQLSTATRIQIAATSAFIVGPLIWMVVSYLTEKEETWDSDAYILSSLLASFIIAIATYRWKEVVGGWFFGQFMWFASFEREIIDGNLAEAVAAMLATSLAPLVGALVGYAIRWIVEYIRARRSA